jgi:hypothetical protein
MAFLAVTLVVLIGVPLFVIPFVRRGPKDDLARPLKFLHWGFWLTILSFAISMTLETLLPSTEPRSPFTDLASNLLFAAFYFFAWLYWTSLATLSSRRGRSAPLWVAVGLITLAIGFVVTYIVMGKGTKTELNAKQA